MWCRRFAGAVALVLVVGTGLAGCASGGAPAAAPVGAERPARASSAAPSPPPSPRPSPTPFVSSADEAGAFAFVKAYFAELDRAFATGDVWQLEPYRDVSCSCVGFERQIRNYAAA